MIYKYPPQNDLRHTSRHGWGVPSGGQDLHGALTFGYNVLN